MKQGSPSIEDLFKKDDSDVDELTAQEKLDIKMKEIKIKELERETQKRATEIGLPYVDLKGFAIIPEALLLVSKENALKLRVISFFQAGNKVYIGVTDPTNPEIVKLAQKIEEEKYYQIVPHLISENSFKLGFALYDAIPKIIYTGKGVSLTENDLNKFSEEQSSIDALNSQIQKVPLTEAVTLITAAAIKARASDIHIEAEEKTVKVRYRIDGILHTVATLKYDAWKKIASRIKLLANLKLNIVDRPQDGRFTISLSNEKIDVRTSTIPTAYGESIVMRLLMSSAVGLNFDQLGVRGLPYEKLKREVGRPNGMVITTGPTGSGKTTTLYAVLNKLNDPKTKICTLEDPIEYKLEGINQSQITRKQESVRSGAGKGSEIRVSESYDFPSGLRSLLRQDPDIIMVGEIRDLETAETAINAALTGHLVLSTLHTNSAAGAIPRFMAMGVKPFLLAPALNSIIAQRLVRKICPGCKQEITLKPEEEERVKKILSAIPKTAGIDLDMNNLKFYKGKGCDTCHNIGYKGRIGVFEIIIMDKEIEKIILSGKVSEYDMQEIAINKGMITMVQDGILKAMDGITSLDEVFRVAQEE